MSDKPGVCIYHDNCTDGFGAAWAVHSSSIGDFYDYIPAQYGESPPDVARKHVLIVDFSYPLNVVQSMASRAASIVILDHHKTAEEDLKGFATPGSFMSWDQYVPRIDKSNVAAVFDMNRCGSHIAWNFFHPGVDMPRLLEFIEDRDLWRNQLPGTKEFHAALRSYPATFAFLDTLTNRDAILTLIDEGSHILRYYKKQVEEAVSLAYTQVINDQEFWVANVPVSMASDVAGELALRHNGYGATWYYGKNQMRYYSLRSVGDKDVSIIAQKYGGGGHKNAAGFKIRTMSVYAVDASDGYNDIPV